MKRNTPFLIYIFLAIFSLAVLVATLGACYVTLFGGRHTPYVTLRVPELEGKIWDEALLPDGFCPSIYYANDPDCPAGTVLSQSPAANTERTAKQGQPVLLRVVISRGQQSVRVPALCGSDVRQAKEQLRALGLTVSMREVHTDTQKSYLVLTQSVPAGTELSIGSALTLTYAAPQVTKCAHVPDLVGLDRAGANTALMRAGLLPGKITYRDATDQDSTDTDQAFTVTAQGIPRGSRVPTNTPIDYTLSRTVIPWNFPFAEESSKESEAFTQ